MDFAAFLRLPKTNEMEQLYLRLLNMLFAAWDK